MPVIPRTQRTNRARPQNTLPSRSAVTAAGRADLQTAQSIEQAANIVGGDLKSRGDEMVAKRTEADNAAFVTERYNRIMRSEAERLAEIETSGADVDLQENEKRWNDQLRESLEGAPSVEAQNALKSSLTNSFERKFAPAYSGHKSKMDTRRRFNSTQSALDDIQSEVLTGRTSLPEAIARSEAAITGLAETHGGAVDIDRLRESNNNQIATGVLSTRINNGDSYAVAREIKSGKWDKYTDAKTLGSMLNAANRDIKQRSAASKAQYSKGLEDYVAFLSDGGSNDQMDEKFSPANVEANFGKNAEKVNEAIQDAKDFGAVKSEIATASPSELSRLIKEVEPTSPENYRRESKQSNIIRAAVSQRNKEIANDPAIYTIQNSNVTKKFYSDFGEALESGDQDQINAATSNYVSAQKAMQRNLGLPDQSMAFLPKQMVDNVAARIADTSKGGESSALQINSLKTAFGNDWGQVQKQLTASGKLPPSFNVTAGMEFGQDQIATIEAMAVKDSDMKAVIGDDDFKDIRIESNNYLEDFKASVTAQPGGERVYSDHKVAIERLASKYVADFSLSANDALEKATYTILNNRFEFVDSMRIPKSNDVGSITDAVDNTIDRIKGGDEDLLIPFSSSIINEEDRASVYRSKLQPNAITSPDGEGIMFIDSYNNAILDSQGMPIIKTWKQLELEGSRKKSFFFDSDDAEVGPMSDLGIQ